VIMVWSNPGFRRKCGFCGHWHKGPCGSVGEKKGVKDLDRSASDRGKKDTGGVGHGSECVAELSLDVDGIAEDDAGKDGGK
jgi:hypothetical protein